MKKLVIILLAMVAVISHAEVKLGAATTNTTLLTPEDIDGFISSEIDTLDDVVQRGNETTGSVKARGAIFDASNYNENVYGGSMVTLGLRVKHGADNLVSADYAHAEGSNTIAGALAAHSEGVSTEASGEGSHVAGWGSIASGKASHASGFSAISSNASSFAWQGGSDPDGMHPEGYYGSHGPGSFNINPAGGLAGFWIGEQTLESILASSVGSGASAATNYAAWVASTDWRELPVYTSGAACLPLFAPVLLSGSPWGVLFGTSNVQQRVRMTATAPGSALAATQAVIRATWWANSTADALAVWTGWNQAQTNTLTAAATGTVQTAVWTNAAGSGSIYADVPVTGNGTSGYTAFPRLEVIWR